jgi:hypothetical protein
VIITVNIKKKVEVKNKMMLLAVSLRLAAKTGTEMQTGKATLFRL